ncbi:hypothetical protein Taro_028532 [Colocasia esculenta]|uniref:Uncharacterized protein n=1 Tax=Colocasia esculenta TaxID=4460 RepID=A0A843VBH5_COLES|nr:hypothetical protein [Colocasia esculenta]
MAGAELAILVQTGEEAGGPDLGGSAVGRGSDPWFIQKAITSVWVFSFFFADGWAERDGSAAFLFSSVRELVK